MAPSEDIGDLATALLVGLLIGLQRERSKARASGLRGEPGVRTCLLLALVGAVAGRIGAAAVVVAGLGVVALIAVNRWRQHAEGAGAVAEIVMLATFLLGMFAQQERELAIALGVTVALLLAGTARLHALARHWLSQRELQDLLILATAIFVVLPLLPDHAIDPWQVLNPRKLWLLAVAIMAIASVGYIALRTFGSHLGLGLAGLAGGFVSSTATIASMAERARLAPALAPAAASAGLMSNVSMIVQLAVVVGAISPSLLRDLALPLAAAAATAIVAALLSSRHVVADPGQVRALAGTRPFEPLAAVRFVALLAGVMLLAAAVRDWLGSRSLVGVMALSGLIDVHAAAASVAQLHTVGRMDRHDALLGVLIAVIANSLLKCVVARAKGTGAYAWRIVPGTTAMVLAFGSAMLAG